MPLSQWLITTNYYEGGYFRTDLSSLSLPHRLTLSISRYFPTLSPLLSWALFFLFASHLSVFARCLRLLPLSSSLSAVVWLQLIVVEINKACKFVFLAAPCHTEEGRCFHGGFSPMAGVHICGVASNQRVSQTVNRVYSSVWDAFTPRHELDSALNGWK